MDQHDADVDEAMRREILAYLGAHPQAADTAEGACGWWFQTNKTGATVERVRKVLDRLAVEGLVKRTEVAGGPVVYSARVSFERRCRAGSC